MGFTDEAFGWTEEQAAHRVLDALSSHDGAQLVPLDGGATWRPAFPDPTPIQFGTVFPLTAERTIDLAPAVLGPAPYRWDPVLPDRYPLSLVSPATAKTVNSTMGQYALEELCVELHPDDALARGIAEGDRVRVFNDVGEVVCRARVTDRIRSGVVLIPKGAWRASSGNGATATALCSADVNPVAGGACYNDARVEVRLNTQ
jgi:anaerobic selenocysteine-containing dehydrogenase